MDMMIELPAMRRSADAAYPTIGTRSVRAAELAPNTADADSRTVEVVWSAGARVRRASFFGAPYDEELSLDPAHVRLERLNAGAPFLKVHELDTLDAVIGTVVPGSARIENGRGIAQVRIRERDGVGDLDRGYSSVERSPEVKSSEKCRAASTTVSGFARKIAPDASFTWATYPNIA